MTSNSKHILIFRLSAMGDVAMIVPILRGLEHQYPEIKITVVSRPFFEPIFQDLTNTSFYPIDLKKKHKGFLGLLKLFVELRKLNIDAVADLHNVLRSKVIRTLFSLTGVKTAATDKGRAEKKELTRLTQKTIRPLKSMIERHSETLLKLGFKLDLDQVPNAPKIELNKKLLNFTGVKKEKWIGIAPFAQHDAKVYPLDLMQKVIDELATFTDYKIYLFGGGQKEIKQLETLQNKHTQVLVVAGIFNFSEELNLIQHLDLMISMDSGNGHLAAMNGIPVITLWGATHPYAGFMPFKQSIHNSFVPNLKQYPWLPTSIYGNKNIKGYENAMRSILPETILAKVHEILNVKM